MENSWQEAMNQAFREFQETMMTEFTKLMQPSKGHSSNSGHQKENMMTEYRMAVKKVELPSFDCDDPVGWITRAETYFEVQGISEEVKVKLAKLSMEGPTIHWFNLLRETEEDLTWEKLKQALIERYGGRQSDNPFEELKDLQQTGNVDEYITAFEYISPQVRRLPEQQYLGYFLGGLKPELRLKVFTTSSHEDSSRRGRRGASVFDSS